jgi:predicted molibdopterin-dependent oxidoreductase YjgC
MLPEEADPSLDACRLPLSAIAEADIVVILGDHPPAERAPVLDLWVKAARRRGAEVVTIGPEGTVPAMPGAAASVAEQLAGADSELGGRLRAAERAVLVWSGSGGRGGAHIARLSEQLGLSGRPGCGALHVPATPNARGVTDAWAAASDGESGDPHPIGVLVVSGDEAAADPAVRALAEQAESVIALSMFQGLVVGWADLVLPATSYLEREGTSVNLEGRLQRLRRAAIPPVVDELAWLSRLGARFGVSLAPHAAGVFHEVSATVFGGLALSEVGETAELRAHIAPPRPVPEPAEEPRGPRDGHFLRLLRYRALFSGPAVERTPELQFQRPPAEVELALDDASRRGVTTGDEVLVRSNGTSRTLRARLNRRLQPGVVRVAEEHAGDLHDTVEVVKP